VKNLDTIKENGKTPELLAPAGGADAFRAAVKWGADAVYIGLKNPFNARTKADNFGIDELPEYMTLAHKNGVRVYIAFNTLIRQSELARAAEDALTAYRAGADALIVQDLGLAKVLLSLASDVVLHLSTQAGIHNAEGALYARDHGFRRVILSRETPLTEIRNIKEKTGIEVEVFAHGALCVSFSGACYFSSIATGNSGNRGKCLQLCRKSYAAYERGSLKAEGYLLSPADLCLLNELTNLRDAGVDCVKIEGRMRRPEYVAEATRSYRRALDGICDPDALDRLKTVYNRGDYSTGYLYGVRKGFISDSIQGHKGLFAGEIVRVNGRFLEVKGKRKPGDGDAFKILREGREVGSALCEKGRLVYSGKPRPGDKLHITTSARLTRELLGKPESCKPKASDKLQ
jgi:putative protease